MPKATNNRQHQQQQPTSTSTTETNNKNINQPPPLINLPFLKKKAPSPPKKNHGIFSHLTVFVWRKHLSPSRGVLDQVPGVVLPNLYVSIVNPWPCGSRPKTDGSGSLPSGLGAGFENRGNRSRSMMVSMILGKNKSVLGF